jgi:hypothetical protein
MHLDRTQNDRHEHEQKFDTDLLEIRTHSRTYHSGDLSQQTQDTQRYHEADKSNQQGDP